jgi:hypothetical protein
MGTDAPGDRVNARSRQTRIRISAHRNSVGNNWKNQMLANLVKIRFVDMPVFVDVGQIVSGYTLEAQVASQIGFGNSLTGTNQQVFGAGGKYTDRPTITYTPKTGENYLRSLLTPVDPNAILSLVLAGYSPELLFTWSVESINGVRNYSTARAGFRDADPRFQEFLQLLNDLQDAGGIGFKLDQAPDSSEKLIFFFTQRTLTPEMTEKRKRIRELIDLDPGRDSFRVVYSPFAMEPDVLAIQTRSILQTLFSMSGFVDVPADKQSWAAGGYRLPPGEHRPFHVNTSKERPESAYAIFEYAGDWYWIDHTDLDSKRVFSLMLFLTTLTNQAEDKDRPVLTIPTD